jgi:hypothetical protein
MSRLVGVDFMATGSVERLIQVDNELQRIEPHSIDEVARFRPTIVLDSAFITREKLKFLGLNKYVSTNLELINMSRKIASLDSVKRYIGFSSVAVTHLAGHQSFELGHNPYAALKKTYENELVKLGEVSGKQMSIPRVFSVSGAYVNRPEIFAFSDFILPAKQGKIKLKSTERVLEDLVL